MTELVLKTGRFEIAEDSTLNAIRVTAENIEGVISPWNIVTNDDLEEVKIAIDGNISGEYFDLVFVSATVTLNEDKTVTASFALREKTENERLMDRIAELEAEQRVQNAAIVELDEAINE